VRRRDAMAMNPCTARLTPARPARVYGACRLCCDVRRLFGIVERWIEFCLYVSMPLCLYATMPFRYADGAHSRVKRAHAHRATVRIRELSALMHIARPRDRDFCHQVHLGGAALARFKQRTVALAAVLETHRARNHTRCACLPPRTSLRPHAPPARAARAHASTILTWTV